MKVDGRGFDALLRASERYRAVLLYGDDAGLVHARATALVRSAAGRLDDPFLVTEVSADSLKRAPGGLADAVAMLPMGGGRMVVRVRDAGDAAAGAVQSLLEPRAGAARPPGLLVLEAGQLTARSKLRVAMEKAPDGAAVACYFLEPAALASALGEDLAAAGSPPGREALALLARLAGPGIVMARSEAEKLALYAGAGMTPSVDDVLACCAGDAAGLAEDAFQAAAVGDVARADAALERALAEGATGVGIVRGALLAFQRLRQAAALVGGGMSAAEAGRALRPPVFFRQEAGFVRALGLWSLTRLIAFSKSSGPASAPARAPDRRRNCWPGAPCWPAPATRPGASVGLRAAEQLDDPVQLIQCAIDDAHLAARAGAADRHAQTQPLAEVMFERLDIGIDRA